ncbi:MAG TPA: hypothetical protein VMT03_24695 [Polyangia bacterium]|nr:hypothetical protein [Polyangia bacterium]
MRAVQERVQDGTVDMIESRDVTTEGRVFTFAEHLVAKEVLRISLRCRTCQLFFELSLCGSPSLPPAPKPS